MASCEKILVATFGIKGTGKRLMQTICMISEGRRRVYELLNADASEAPHIVIADGDNPRAMAAWVRFQSNYPTVPAIMVARRPAEDSTDLQVGRPIKATGLLELLDRMSTGRGSPAGTLAESEDREKVSREHRTRRTTVGQGVE